MEYAKQLEMEGKLRPVSDVETGIKEQPVGIIIPECCREGWASCPHYPRKAKPAKKNIGL